MYCIIGIYYEAFNLQSLVPIVNNRLLTLASTLAKIINSTHLDPHAISFTYIAISVVNAIIKNDDYFC